MTYSVPSLTLDDFQGEDSYRKTREVLVGNFQKKTIRGTKIPFCGHDLKLFSPLRVIISKQHIISCLNDVKG